MRMGETGCVMKFQGKGRACSGEMGPSRDRSKWAETGKKWRNRAMSGEGNKSDIMASNTAELYLSIYCG